MIFQKKDAMVLSVSFPVNSYCLALPIALGTFVLECLPAMGSIFSDKGFITKSSKNLYDKSRYFLFPVMAYRLASTSFMPPYSHRSIFCNCSGERFFNVL